MSSDKQRRVTKSYDRIAYDYAQHFAGELRFKPLDRALLDTFVEDVGGSGIVCDVGCGPGQVARYLDDKKLHVIAIDASEQMIAYARATTTNVDYRVGSMTELDLADGSIAGMTAFYALCHLELSELPPVLAELHRVLRPSAPLLLSFHVGTERIHRSELWGEPVDLEWVLVETKTMVDALQTSGFVVEAKLERAPYPPVEETTTRGYILARKPR